MNRAKALIAWSSGKDSAWALHEMRRAGTFDIVAALTTVTETFDRISMHGVREELLTAQLDAAELPGMIVRIPFPCPNDIYEQRMAAALVEAKAAGGTHVLFGDLFLQAIRAYREARLAEVGMTPLFPLWHRPTNALAREMIESGVEARLVCIDLKTLPRAFAGRRFDYDLIDSLAPGVDPCGENGEFHSFVAAGAVLHRAIPITTGETVEREGFAYADLMKGAS